MRRLFLVEFGLKRKLKNLCGNFLDDKLFTFLCKEIFSSLKWNLYVKLYP